VTLPAQTRLCFVRSPYPHARIVSVDTTAAAAMPGVRLIVTGPQLHAAGVKPMPTEQVPAFMTQAVLALSDITLYPAPMALMLKDFTQVQASVFQVARAPGKTLVYLGCALLILGVFSMLYVRERRLWVWLAPQADAAQSQATMALSTNRKTLDGDQEFVHLTRKLLGNEAPTV
jgi:cytochrome c biogenesis protein